MENRKRRPLSDMSNTYNLISTSALRKIVASTNSSEKRPLGSSSVSDTRNSGAHAISSITSQGGMGSRDAACIRRQTNEKSKKERDAAVQIISPTTAEKRKDRGKAPAIPFGSLFPEKVEDNQNEIFARCSPLEREKQKDEASLHLFSTPVNLKGSTEGILITYSCSKEKREKGKAILNSSSCSTGKQKETGKFIVDHFSCPLEKTNDGKEVIFMSSGSSTVKTRETGKELVDPSSFLVERTKEKENPLNPLSSLCEKTREKLKATPQPSGIVEITKHKGLSAAVAVNYRSQRRKTEKRKNDAGDSSCPPMMRTKNILNDLNEAGDIKSSKSWTDQPPKRSKKRRSRTESTNEWRDFVEQQRAYFKEIDEFELLVEEVSEDKID